MAISEHRRLKHLFRDGSDLQKSLSLIKEELECHIRFEERIIPTEIQKKASQEQLLPIEQIHSEGKFVNNLTNPFWN